ncbi:Putative RNA 2'-phosphotransferase [Durusdinium trenchii]|uniref:RNA 2'-phosphotransferase n=1 Tax=Durusdinium trenchii TaxID=1381693 RepID=A0ABP0KHH8_9DINO
MFSTRNDLSFALFFAPLCLKHQFHLISQGQLKLIDDIVGGKLDFPARCQWKYYTSVATLSHTWRGHLSKLRDKWIQQHAKDPEFAGMRASFKLPPLAISGRWASIDSAEQFYLETGAQNVRKLFKAVFDKDRQKLETPNAAEAVEDQKDALDELALDEEYQKRAPKPDVSQGQLEDGDGDGPGDDGDGPSNIADPVDDADEEDEDALELEQIERELCGDFAEVDIAMLEQELQSTMEEQDDLADMDRLHRVFVEVASEKQHKDAFCAGDIESNDGNLEKDIGDVLLEHYLSQSPNEQQSCAAKKEHATATTALDASSINDSLIAWSSSMEHFLSSMEPIANQLKAFDVSAVDSCLGHDLSLVITENDAVYVSWLQPYKNLTGRSVQLDDDGGGIYPSHFRPKQNFSGSVIVAPSCGVRVKKKDRQIMPHDFQRLRQSCLAAFQVVVDDADFFIFDDDGAGRNCIACHQSSSSPSDLPPQRCSVCLKLWHSNCSKQAALRLANFAQLHKAATFQNMFPAQDDAAYKHIRRALASDVFTQQHGIMTL